MCAALEARFGADLISVVLFGSWARGQGERRRPAGRDPRVARGISGEFADRVSLIVATPEGAERVKRYCLGMLSGLVRLRDQGGFFRAVLDLLQMKLQELGSPRCVDDDGDEYRDLKPDWMPGDVVSL